MCHKCAHGYYVILVGWASCCETFVGSLGKLKDKKNATVSRHIPNYRVYTK